MREVILSESYVMSRPQERSDSSRFQPGAKVRVRYGVIVPDLPDIPLGGWTGIITASRAIRGGDGLRDQVESEDPQERPPGLPETL